MFRFVLLSIYVEKLYVSKVPCVSQNGTFQPLHYFDNVDTLASGFPGTTAAQQKSLISMPMQR